MSRKITIEVTVNQPCQKVWELFNNPEHIVKWNFSSDDWHCPEAENDLVVGGKLRSRMEAKDGSVGFDFEGIYDEIIVCKEIAYTLPDGRKVVTTFEDQGDATHIITIFNAEEDHTLDIQRAGWQAILNNFKHYAESLTQA